MNPSLSWQGARAVTVTSCGLEVLVTIFHWTCSPSTRRKQPSAVVRDGRSDDTNRGRHDVTCLAITTDKALSSSSKISSTFRDIRL